MAYLSYDVHRTISGDRPVTREQLAELNEQVSQNPLQLSWLTGDAGVHTGVRGRSSSSSSSSGDEVK
jgi:hypothetical protein